MNSLMRVSAVLTNAPYLLNVDCDHYINNSKAIREINVFHDGSHIGEEGLLCAVSLRGLMVLIGMINMPIAILYSLI